MHDCYVPDPVAIQTEALFPELTRRERDLIRDGKIANGMRKVAVQYSLGSPNDIDRTVKGDHVREEWCYGTFIVRGQLVIEKRLYFDDGVLTSWED